MQKKVLRIKKISSDEELRSWESFIKNNNGGFFQSPDFYKLSGYLPDIQSVVVCAYWDDIIVGSVLASIYTSGKRFKKYMSRRAIIIGGPVLDNAFNIKEVNAHLLKGLNITLKKKVIYTEFRNLSDLSDLKNTFFEEGYSYNEHLNVQVNLGDENKLMSQISKSKKRQIKKSRSNGAKIIEADNIEQVRSFYAILFQLYKTKIKLPLPKWNFFERLFYFGKETGSVKYFLIEFEKEIIGGILCPQYRGTIYEWYIGNSNKENIVYPGVLATWAPIEYGLKNGLLQFDFMGAGRPDEDYGVRDFKLKFGGELVNHGRFLKINNQLLYNIGKTVLKLLRK